MSESGYEVARIDARTHAQHVASGTAHELRRAEVEPRRDRALARSGVELGLARRLLRAGLRRDRERVVPREEHVVAVAAERREPTEGA